MAVKQSGISKAKELTEAVNSAMLEICKFDNQNSLDQGFYSTENIDTKMRSTLALRGLITKSKLEDNIIWVRFTEKGEKLLKQLANRAEKSAQQLTVATRERMHWTHEMNQRHITAAHDAEFPTAAQEIIASMHDDLLTRESDINRLEDELARMYKTLSYVESLLEEEKRK